MTQHLLHGKQVAPNVAVERVEEVFIGDVGQRGELPTAGVGEDDVESVPVIGDGSDQGPAGGALPIGPSSSGPDETPLVATATPGPMPAFRSPLATGGHNW